MELLILGGGNFVGPALAAGALQRGWRVSCLSRGHAPLPAGCRHLSADRNDPATVRTVLLRENPDFAIDTWSGAPAAVSAAAHALAGSGCRYAYVSSRSVYTVPTADDADEEHFVVDSAPATGGHDYAANKRGGELAAISELGPERVLLLRAGLIFGPGENSGRLTWWLARMNRGGRVLVPGPPGMDLRVIDVRDLAAFALDRLQRGDHGTYDVGGPADRTTARTLLESCWTVTGSQAELVWADGGWLVKQGVEPFTELPIWSPAGHPLHGLHTGCTGKAEAAGLTSRPVAETVSATWAAFDPAATHGYCIGLAADREQRLLAAWDAYCRRYHN